MRKNRTAKGKTRPKIPNNYDAPTLVMNIKREFFSAILSQPRRKAIEYRNLTDYWLNRLDRVGPAPFNLRLLNGMMPPVPEATIRVKKVVTNERSEIIELHLGRVIKVLHWNRKSEQPC